MSGEEKEMPGQGEGATPMWGYIHRRRTDMPEDAAHQEQGRQGGEKGEDKDKKDKDRDGKGEDGDKDKKDDKQKKISPRKKRMLIVVAIIVVILLIILGVAFYLYERQFENTDDAFIDGHVSQVSPRINGEVLTLHIRDNERVEAGQLLVEIDPRDYEVRLTQAQAEKAQSEAQVLLQQANVGEAQANVHVAEAQVFQADRDLARFRAIDKKAITTQQLDNAIANARSANAKLEANREVVEAAKGQLAVAEASVKTADADIANAELQLSYTKIVSPITGRVARRTVEVGNVVASGQPLLAIVSDDMWVTANFKETQITKMRVGQAVGIYVDAYPQKVLHGHVDSFQRGSGSVFSSLPAENATGNYVKVVQRVPVKIVFDNADERDRFPIAPGLSVEPRVTVR